MGLAVAVFVFCVLKQYFNKRSGPTKKPRTQLPGYQRKVGNEEIRVRGFSRLFTSFVLWLSFSNPCKIDVGNCLASIVTG